MSNDTPRVSVVMPAFNAARTIGASIESVLNQSCGPLEVLVGDDASTDNTADIVRAFRATNVRLISNEENLGPGPTRDRLIAEARGEWIAFLDADDLMQAERLRRMLDVAANLPDCILFDDILLCHETPTGLRPFKRLRGSSGASIAHIPFPEYVGLPKLMIQPIVRTNTILSRGVRHTNGRYGEDANFFLTLAARGASLHYLPEPLYLYRLTPGSATKNRQRQRLLREQIALVLDEPALSIRDRVALEGKIATLHREEQYDAFVDHLRASRYREAMRDAMQDPSLFPRLLKRAVSDVYYHAHRRLRSGRAR